jgi:plasmid maintenance system killer protein
MRRAQSSARRRISTSRSRLTKFHPLTGDVAGHYAVTVTGNRRVTFRIEGQDISDVDYPPDYH